MLSPALLKTKCAALAEQVEHDLNVHLPEDTQPPGLLHQAMRYSLFAGGKRFRPTLVFLSHELSQKPNNLASGAAMAVEMIHTYSLIHDDLPCLDNDDLRRGLPTCHKQFGEAHALLAGDALLTEAFGMIGKHCEADLVADLIQVLAEGAGSQGMVGGQVGDVALTGQEGNLQQVRFIHELKTAALIRCSVEMGAITGRLEAQQRKALRDYGQNLGLAFQATDDILDVTASTQTLGKTAGKDAEAGKNTLVATVGLDRARKMAGAYRDQAVAALESFGQEADLLRAMADLVIERES